MISVSPNRCRALAVPVLAALAWSAAVAQTTSPLTPGPANPPFSTATVPAAAGSDRLAKLSPLGRTPDWSLLETYNGTMTREEFEAAWRDIYSDSAAFPPPWQFQDNALLVQTGDPENPTARVGLGRPIAGAEVPPPSRYWRRADELPALNGRPPLSDVHIALDAGHIGGGYARMEERYLSFQAGEAVQEGDLTLLTAQVLMKRLQDLGAYVTLVRETTEPLTEQRPTDFHFLAVDLLREAGVTNPKATYEGLTGEQKLLTIQWQSEKLFYRVSEIQARAAKVNDQIKPDVVLCLHFNAEAWGDPAAPQFSPANHFHAIINGCYALAELELQDVRFDMMRRLLGRVHEEELPLAEAVADGVALTTKLPAYVYTTGNARHAGLNSYIYARNLLANRLYQCPVVYLEPYVMNHEQTYRRLLLGHYVGRTLIGGTLQTSAIEDYVRGVVRGLLGYYQGKRRSS